MASGIHQWASGVPQGGMQGPVQGPEQQPTIPVMINVCVPHDYVQIFPSQYSVAETTQRIYEEIQQLQGGQEGKAIDPARLKYLVGTELVDGISTQIFDAKQVQEALRISIEALRRLGVPETELAMPIHILKQCELVNPEIQGLLQQARTLSRYDEDPKKVLKFQQQCAETRSTLLAREEQRLSRENLVETMDFLQKNPELKLQFDDKTGKFSLDKRSQVKLGKQREYVGEGSKKAGEQLLQEFRLQASQEARIGPDGVKNLLASFQTLEGSKWGKDLLNTFPDLKGKFESCREELQKLWDVSREVFQGKQDVGEPFIHSSIYDHFATLEEQAEALSQKADSEKIKAFAQEAAGFAAGIFRLDLSTCPPHEKAKVLLSLKTLETLTTSIGADATGIRAVYEGLSNPTDGVGQGQMDPSLFSVEEKGAAALLGPEGQGSGVSPDQAGEQVSDLFPGVPQRPTSFDHDQGAEGVSQQQPQGDSSAVEEKKEVSIGSKMGQQLQKLGEKISKTFNRERSRFQGKPDDSKVEERSFVARALTTARQAMPSLGGIKKAASKAFQGLVERFSGGEQEIELSGPTGGMKMDTAKTAEEGVLQKIKDTPEDPNTKFNTEPLPQDFYTQTMEKQCEAHGAARTWLTDQMKELEKESTVDFVRPDQEKIGECKEDPQDVQIGKLDGEVFSAEVTHDIKEDIQASSKKEGPPVVIYGIASQFNSVEAPVCTLIPPGKVEAYEKDKSQGSIGQIAFGKKIAGVILAAANRGLSVLSYVLPEELKGDVRFGYLTPSKGSVKKVAQALHDNGGKSEYLCVGATPEGGKRKVFEFLVAAPALGVSGNSIPGVEIPPPGDPERNKLEYATALNGFLAMFKEAIKVAEGPPKTAVQLKPSATGLGVFGNSPENVAKAFSEAARVYGPQLKEAGVTVQFQLFQPRKQITATEVANGEIDKNAQTVATSLGLKIPGSG